jgi:hypothetical protein
MNSSPTARDIDALHCSHRGLVGCGAAALGLASRADAAVTQIDISCVQSPTFGGQSFGAVGQYELIQGTITGEVDPANPQDAVIVDIAKAPRNARGMVTYTADFQILRPINLSQGNHRVIFDLPNRGGATALSTFNNGTANTRAWCSSGLPANFTVGNGFLMNKGFTIVETAWDITVTPAGSTTSSSFGVTFPVAKNRDGSSITGPSTEEFDIDFTATAATEPLHYAAATGDQSKATLTVRENYGDTPRNSGTLVPSLPQSGMGFPNIPGVFYNGIMHTGDLFNFGPRFREDILDVQPPVLLGTPYPVFVPRTDADGNDIAGIRLPDISVPLATYTGYAYRAQVAGDPVPMVDGCDASGQRIPFAQTKAARLAAGDPRLSIDERYRDHATYVSLVTQAAAKLEAERLMLDADVQAYIAAAQAATVP